MDKYSIFSTVSGIIFVLGFGPYIYAILRKGARPMKSTWIVYAIVDTILLVQIIAADAFNGLLVGAVIGSTCVVYLSMKHGVPGWSKLDKVTLGASVFGVVLWIASGNPVVGILASSAVLFGATVPSYVSAWKNPSNEDKLGWTLYWISAIFGLFAARDWSLSEVAAPITFVVIESIMVFILYTRPRFITEKT